MAIVMIYHHEERTIADEWAIKLEQAGYEVELAPLGFEVGSDAWTAKVFSDLKDADAVLLLLSKKSVADEWVMRRASYALQENKMLIPIDIDEYDLSDRPVFISTLQSLGARDPHTHDFIFANLLNALPKTQRRVLCFISYSRSERDFAVKLAADLRNHGVNIWRDEDDIPAGASWDQAIQIALGNCTHVLLVATPRSVESPNVLDEISFARENEKVIIPLMLEDCELPFRVHRAQRVDFRGGYNDGLTELLCQLGMEP